MNNYPLLERFCAAATAAGAEVRRSVERTELPGLLAGLARGPVLLPSFVSGRTLQLAEGLQRQGIELIDGDFRRRAAEADLGITGANFALAETGTLVLESTPEPIRLASTLPERHAVILDPRKILADLEAATPWLRRFAATLPRHYLAYITGPSRTADIERVLTIGVHGPKELFIFLVEGLSDDPLEM